MFRLVQIIDAKIIIFSCQLKIKFYFCTPKISGNNHLIYWRVVILLFNRTDEGGYFPKGSRNFKDHFLWLKK
jgi:hypothetical protein